MAQSRSSLPFALQHVVYVICKVLERFNPPFINLPLAFNIGGFFNYCRIAMWTCFCSQLEVCNSSEVASKQKKTKCRPGDRHLWLLAAVASCSCASGFLSRMCSRFPLLAARVTGQQASAPGSSNRSQRLSVQLLFNSKTHSCHQGCWESTSAISPISDLWWLNLKIDWRRLGRMCNEVCWEERSKRISW